MKLKNVFADSFMNCIIIVLIKFYSSTSLLNQKSVKLIASWLQMKKLLVVRVFLPNGLVTKPSLDGDVPV